MSFAQLGKTVTTPLPPGLARDLLQVLQDAGVLAAGFFYDKDGVLIEDLVDEDVSLAADDQHLLVFGDACDTRPLYGCASDGMIRNTRCVSGVEGGLRHLCTLPLNPFFFVGKRAARVFLA